MRYLRTKGKEREAISKKENEIFEGRRTSDELREKNNGREGGGSLPLDVIKSPSAPSDSQAGELVSFF